MKSTDMHRIRALSLQRRIYQENIEQNLESKFTKLKKAQMETRLEKDEILATEIERLSKDAFKEIKLRQQLRGSSWELRELESKLYTGYCNKEVAAQIAEKEAARLKDKVHEIQINKIMAAQRMKAELNEKEKLQEYHKKKLQRVHEIQINKIMAAQRMKAELNEKEKLQEYHKKKLQYKRDLDEQICILESKHQREYEEFVKEKVALDDVICSVKEESQREENLKILKMEQMKKDMEEFQKAQALRKQKEKEAAEEEHRSNIEYLKRKEREVMSKTDEAYKQHQIKLLLQEKLAHAIEEEMCERLEKNSVIQDLAVENSMELQEQKYRKQLEIAVRNSELLRESYRQQIEEKKQKLKEEEQFETTYRQQLLEKLAREEELEKMTAEKQRIIKMQHRRHVREILEERRGRQVDEMQTIIALEKLHQLEEAKMHTLIEEERMKMLKTHATNLVGYLPKRVLRKDEAIYFGIKANSTK